MSVIPSDIRVYGAADTYANALTMVFRRIYTDASARIGHRATSAGYPIVLITTGWVDSRRS